MAKSADYYLFSFSSYRENNHTHRLPGKGTYCSNSTMGGANTPAPLRWKFWVENYPTTFSWTKGYSLPSLTAFAHTVSKCINNTQTNKQTFFFIYIHRYMYIKRREREPITNVQLICAQCTGKRVCCLREHLCFYSAVLAFEYNVVNNFHFFGLKLSASIFYESYLFVFASHSRL